MAKTAHSSPLVPRYVHNLNRKAEACGLSVSVGHEILENWPAYEWIADPVVVSRWKGTKQQLLATGLLQPSYRIPLTAGWLSAPISSGWQTDRPHAHLYGYIVVCRDAIELELYGGPIPRSIERRDNVEVTTFESEIAYHGSRDALLSFGMFQPSQFPTKKWVCNSWSRRPYNAPPALYWITRRQPDGTFVHFRETESAFGKRRKAAEEESREEAREKEQKRCADLSDYKNVDEYRERLEDLIGHFARTVASVHGSVETRHGYRYTADRAGLNRVIDAVEAAAQGLRNVPVKVVNLNEGKSTKVTRQLATGASTDPLFQRFLKSLQGGATP